MSRSRCRGSDTSQELQCPWHRAWLIKQELAAENSEAKPSEAEPSEEEPDEDEHWGKWRAPKRRKEASGVEVPEPKNPPKPAPSEVPMGSRQPAEPKFPPAKVQAVPTMPPPGEAPAVVAPAVVGPPPPPPPPPLRPRRVPLRPSMRTPGPRLWWRENAAMRVIPARRPAEERVEEEVEPAEERVEEEEVEPEEAAPLDTASFPWRQAAVDQALLQLNEEPQTAVALPPPPTHPPWARPGSRPPRPVQWRPDGWGGFYTGNGYVDPYGNFWPPGMGRERSRRRGSGRNRDLVLDPLVALSNCILEMTRRQP